MAELLDAEPLLATIHASLQSSLDAVFGLLDVDGGGQIEYNELKQMTHHAQQAASPEKLADVAEFHGRASAHASTLGRS